MKELVALSLRDPSDMSSEMSLPPTKMGGPWSPGSRYWTIVMVMLLSFLSEYRTRYDT